MDREKNHFPVVTQRAVELLPMPVGNYQRVREADGQARGRDKGENKERDRFGQFHGGFR